MCHRAAGGHGSCDGCCRRRGLLPRLQRALRCALRPRAARSPHGQHRGSRGICVDDSAGIVDSRSVGRHVRPPLHAPVRCDEGEDFGRVAVVARRHAANNPAAWFYERPITLEDHQNSRWIAEPLHLLDCCQETDGGQALVIVSAERAKDLANKPVVIKGAAQGSSKDQHMMTSYYRPDISGIGDEHRICSSVVRPERPDP